MRLHLAAQDRVESADEYEKEDQSGNSVEHIDQSHHERIDLSAGISCDHPINDSDHEAHSGAGDTNQKRNAGSQQHTKEQVSSVEVRAKGMFRRGWKKAVGGYLTAFGR